MTYFNLNINGMERYHLTSSMKTNIYVNDIAIMGIMIILTVVDTPTITVINSSSF